MDDGQRRVSEQFQNLPITTVSNKNSSRLVILVKV